MASHCLIKVIKKLKALLEVLNTLLYYTIFVVNTCFQMGLLEEMVYHALLIKVATMDYALMDYVIAMTTMEDLLV